MWSFPCLFVLFQIKGTLGASNTQWRKTRRERSLAQRSFSGKSLQKSESESRKALKGRRNERGTSGARVCIEGERDTAFSRREQPKQLNKKKEKNLSQKMRKYIQSQAEERAERVRNTRRQAQTSIAASHIHTTIMQSFSMILFLFFVSFLCCSCDYNSTRWFFFFIYHPKKEWSLELEDKDFLEEKDIYKKIGGRRILPGQRWNWMDLLDTQWKYCV
jgi:hypothetical protein